jgi:nucleoid DNA-binding protein
MNKADLVRVAAKVVGSQSDAKTAVGDIFEAMRKALQDGDKVVVQGFGSFHVVMRKAKPARNPRTGEAVMIPPRRRVKFKMAKDLLQAGSTASDETVPPTEPAAPN